MTTQAAHRFAIAHNLPKAPDFLTAQCLACGNVVEVVENEDELIYCDGCGNVNQHEIRITVSAKVACRECGEPTNAGEYCEICADCWSYGRERR